MKEFSEKEYDFSKLKIEKLLMDNGKNCEVFFPVRPRERLVFENEFCSFKPVGFARLNGIWFPLAYKVVTENLESLGLKDNPTIMTFPVCRWVNLDDAEVVPGLETDVGGIFTALRKGRIKDLKSHCWDTWEMKSRGFLVAINNPVGNNDYRLKSQGVKLLKEIKEGRDPWQE